MGGAGSIIEISISVPHEPVQIKLNRAFTKELGYEMVKSHLIQFEPARAEH